MRCGDLLDVATFESDFEKKYIWENFPRRTEFYARNFLINNRVTLMKRNSWSWVAKFSDKSEQLHPVHINVAHLAIPNEWLPIGVDDINHLLSNLPSFVIQ